MIDLNKRSLIKLTALTAVASAALIGRTQMSEFAFSGVGTNPHHGTPVNPADASVERIPGGSSSGAAVSVASGAAFIGGRPISWRALLMKGLHTPRSK